MPAPSARDDSRWPRASKLLHRPSGASIDALLKPIVGSGRDHEVDAAGERQLALAVPHALAGQVHGHQATTNTRCPPRRLGPCRLKKYEMRLAAIDSAEPRLV